MGYVRQKFWSNDSQQWECASFPRFELVFGSVSRAQRHRTSPHFLASLCLCIVYYYYMPANETKLNERDRHPFRITVLIALVSLVFIIPHNRRTIISLRVVSSAVGVFGTYTTIYFEDSDKHDVSRQCYANAVVNLVLRGIRRIYDHRYGCSVSRTLYYWKRTEEFRQILSLITNNQIWLEIFLDAFVHMHAHSLILKAH